MDNLTATIGLIRNAKTTRTFEQTQTKGPRLIAMVVTAEQDLCARSPPKTIHLCACRKAAGPISQQEMVGDLCGMACNTTSTVQHHIAPMKHNPRSLVHGLIDTPLRAGRQVHACRCSVCAHCCCNESCRVLLRVTPIAEFPCATNHHDVTLPPPTHQELQFFAGVLPHALV
jgi:hypothetical protein